MSDDKFEKIMKVIAVCFFIIFCTAFAFVVLGMSLDILRKF